MGSYREAIMTGFICRLCSERKNVVIHLYSQRGKNMGLLDKINLLPITVKKYDKLPKTICESCILHLCRQFELVQQVRKNVEIHMRHRRFHTNGCPAECPMYRPPQPSPPPPLVVDTSEEDYLEEAPQDGPEIYSLISEEVTPINPPNVVEN